MWFSVWHIMALSKHSVGEWVNEWMSAWLDFLHLFSCMCLVLLILDPGRKDRFALDFHAGSWASSPHGCQGWTGRATPSEPRKVGVGVSSPQLLRGLCWKQLLACVLGEKKSRGNVRGWMGRIIRPWPSKLPPTQACQTLQENSSRCVSFFTNLMTEERMHQGRLVGPGPID